MYSVTPTKAWRLWVRSTAEQYIAQKGSHMKNEKNPAIHLNPCDRAGLLRLMDQHGDSNAMTIGQNEKGETVTISIFHDKIITKTYQDNGWIRTNYYYRDGSSEELFDKEKLD